ncbi:AlpA family phage regulatory protein [Aliiroseovarius sp. M344]|uniref:helix-turn-helix transcriptional regulator n=1 Tax=Aliiroseovarius sp. M344 TaxID=2867010 RepID=UPI0021AD6783|nr:AlpA family phage regulatory protein [Aliiroseovarius sp. M344]UWQ14196.1 AlpA family phage regulatory protein [Aliiroseovarius sp. M344]
MTQKLYRRTEVEALTGLSSTTLYDMMNRGDFPRPVRIAKRAVAWPESVLSEWFENLPSAEK